MKRAADGRGEAVKRAAGGRGPDLRVHRPEVLPNHRHLRDNGLGLSDCAPGRAGAPLLEMVTPPDPVHF